MALHCNAHVFALKCQHCTGTMTTIFRLITLLDSLFGIRISFCIKNKKIWPFSILNFRWYFENKYHSVILSRWKNKNKQTKNEWPKIAKTSIKRVSRRVIAGFSQLCVGQSTNLIESWNVLLVLLMETFNYDILIDEMARTGKVSSNND